jgi:formylmethanofuran dehydrogenase subunit E
MDDASLDDFLDDSDASDDADRTDDAGDTAADAESGTMASEADREGDQSEEDGAAVDPGSVEPATSTYAWSGEAVACAACGEPVERRWRDDAGMVCRACKEW